MGEGQNRGLTQVLTTDLVRNVPALINRLGDELATKLPYMGSTSGTVDTSPGTEVVTHNLGFTPSRVLAQSKRRTPVTDAVLVLAVTDLTSTTFTVRFAAMVQQAGNNYYVVNNGLAGLPYDIDWIAFR